MEKLRYTIAEVAKLADRNYHTIWQAVKENRIGSVVVKGKKLIPHSALLNYGPANSHLISNADLARALGYSTNTVLRWQSSAKTRHGDLFYWNITETLEWLKAERPQDFERFGKYIETKTKRNGDSRQIANN